MNPTLKQTKEDDQTAKENALRASLKIVEKDLNFAKERRVEILIELGKLMVQRIDEE